MSARLVILTEIISPYRIPLFNALAHRPEIDLHVIFMAETDQHLRQWQVYKEEIQFSFQVLPSWRKRVGKYNVLLNRGVGSALAAARPDAVLCGGYSYVTSWQALRWAQSRGIPFLLWSESNSQDLRRGYALVEWLKKRFLRKCQAFVVPGQSAGEYLVAHEIKNSIIFTAPNAVDNDFFSSRAAVIRADAAATRARLGLPNRYFLFTGRLVKEKGVFDLLSAYDRLDSTIREQIGLVFVGDGSCRKQLEDRAATVSQETKGTIKFAGFAQREQLAEYYALADVMILPTYSDPWGLVVNEAMACGLPVIVSRAAGAAADLVKDNWNGWLVPTGDVTALTAAMQSIASQPELRATMGANSFEHVMNYSPDAWAQQIVRAVTVIASGSRG
jgi:glycosyltransferase involved in cell wall biosynthesis